MKWKRNDVIALGLVVIATVFGLSLSVTKPFLAPDAEPVFTFEDRVQEELFRLVENEFGLFTAPTMDDSWLPDGAGNLSVGREVYQVQCIHCHGSDGSAETYTARILNPPPRNLSLGAIVHTSTGPGNPPLRNDVRRLIRDGVPNTSMSSFSGLSEAEQNAAADYVMYLLVRGSVWHLALTKLDPLAPSDAFANAVAEQKARWSSSEVSQ
ncbi:MAG: cytochrome c [Planctomycetota bacterium]|nr:cytochrome c [Planctomycetota bacterium]